LGVTYRHFCNASHIVIAKTFWDTDVKARAVRMVLEDLALQVGGFQTLVWELTWARGRNRPAPRNSSGSEQMRLTSDSEMPDSSPRAPTRSSTFLVETQCT
jgi:hypothetical protein